MLGKVSPQHNCSPALSFSHSSRSCTSWSFFLADHSEGIWRISGQTKCLNSAGEHWEESPSSLKIFCPLQPKSANLPGLYMIIQLVHSKQQHFNQTLTFAAPFEGLIKPSHHTSAGIKYHYASESLNQRQQTHIIHWERAEKYNKQHKVQQQTIHVAKKFSVYSITDRPPISYTHPSKRTGIRPPQHPDPTEEIEGERTQLVLHFLFNTTCETVTHSRPY